MNKPVRATKNSELVRHPHVLADSKDLETYIPYLLNRLTNRWNIDQNRDLGEYGINGTILRALSVLYIFKTLTVNEIANYALVEQSNASRKTDSIGCRGAQFAPIINMRSHTFIGLE